MKRALSFILAFVISATVFFSCGKGDTVPSVSNSASTISADKTAAKEKREKAVQELLSMEHLADYTGFSCSGKTFTYADNGVCYDITYGFSTAFLTQRSPDDGMAMFVCDVEDCNHDNPQCPACIRTAKAISYNDNKLYWVKSDVRDAEKGFAYDYTVLCRDLQSGAAAEISSFGDENLEYLCDIVGFYKGKVVMLNGASVYIGSIKDGIMEKLIDVDSPEGFD